MSKKGFEVGISFFVTLVIALVIFGFAMSFAFRFFGKAKEYQRELDQNTRAQLESLIINSGDRVAVYPTQTELHSGETEVAGLGILNVLNTATENTFTLEVNCTKLIYNDGTAAGPDETETECAKIKLVYLSEYIIKNNDNIITSIAIKNTGAVLGTYIIDARVTTPDAEGVTQVYGGVQKIYLKSI